MSEDLDGAGPVEQGPEHGDEAPQEIGAEGGEHAKAMGAAVRGHAVSLVPNACSRLSGSVADGPCQVS